MRPSANLRARSRPNRREHVMTILRQFARFALGGLALAALQIRPHTRRIIQPADHVRCPLRCAAGSTCWRACCAQIVGTPWQAGGGRESARCRRGDRAASVGRRRRRLHDHFGTSSPFAINVTLNKSLPYDRRRTLRRSCSPRTRRLCCWSIRTDGAIGPDLIKLAKQKPGQLSYARPAGSPSI